MNSTFQIAVGTLGLLAACATAQVGGAPADTQLSVLDQGGESIPGEFEMWSPGPNDTCTSSSYGCAVSVPEGDYNFTFTKIRVGRMVTSGGGNAGGDRGTGCLRSRVHVVPGVAIACRQRVAELSCAASAVETMDCGKASIVNADKARPEQAAAPAK